MTSSSPAAWSRCRGPRWAPRWPAAGARIREAFIDALRRPDPNQGLGAEMIAEQWGFDRHRARRVLPGLTRKGRSGTGFRCLRRPDRAASRTRTAMSCSRTRASAAVRRWRRWLAQAGVQGRRRDPRRQLLADLRRLGRRAVHVGREGEVAGAQAARQGAHRDAGRRRPGDHADRADPGDPEGAEAIGLSSTTSGRTRSTRRSRRSRWPG